MSKSLSSMTAFARQSIQEDWCHATWEIRALNHRHLDIQFRLPDNLKQLEPLLRARIATRLKRGRIEIYLHYQATTCDKLLLNEALLTQLFACYQRVNELIDHCELLNSVQLLSWPGVVQKTVSEDLDDKAAQTLLKIFDITITELIAIRQKEGQVIGRYLLERLNQLALHVHTVKTQLPNLRSIQHAKLKQRFEVTTIQIDPQRFEQELVLSLQKMDVSEELDRLTLHLKECRTLLETGQGVGRRLDFLMQELTREANTLSAKSVDAALSLQIIDIKLLIEEMREQIQNIE